ncbi:MAG: HD domain-containing phosphohydrolase [Desulfatiglans sp.]|jgi:putative nucleotidyltransferase with HDIG domain|nr:response regulator [Thermodesulfobacteriota bacterium]MEE4353702.1 HD domain-containing phosphohydrolase [Desulfatiglans sp.]
MNILIVDDDASTLGLLEKDLGKSGHKVFLAHDGKEAWSKLQSASYDLVLSDWMMPEIDGLELCRLIRGADFKRYIYFIIISAKDVKQEILHGFESGIDDYITKPIDLDDLRARIKVGARIVTLEKDLSEKYDEIRRNYLQTIRMFASLVEVYDEDLGGHSRRVAEISRELAKRHPDVSEEDLPLVETAGLLHDIGMVGLPREILTKKRTEMNGEERQLFLSHPVRGEIILKEIDFLRPIAKLVRAHHEQHNGLGFPDSLPANKIPLLAKILSSASMYDNFVHRGNISYEEVPAKLKQFEGYQLDPALIEILLEINLENIEREKGKTFVEVLVDDLEEGMVLAEDIRMKSGAMVMPRETTLSNYGIERLRGYYHELAGISNKVSVYKSDVRG